MLGGEICIVEGRRGAKIVLEGEENLGQIEHS